MPTPTLDPTSGDSAVPVVGTSIASTASELYDRLSSAAVAAASSTAGGDVVVLTGLGGKSTRTGVVASATSRAVGVERVSIGKGKGSVLVSVVLGIVGGFDIGI
ncbi:hypothetical protein G7Y89_g10993 [Cudoniella acicularis]|uniref:Uncharacterized protein n=1 Tax=Cudoniella acicularis TaxID=354080 RepID=A0A8H4VY90_9HELO|nr:hypothetical protein G7Y89_g10993 [Cudoniella acicularis]